jgi:hypothetical protein
MLREDEVHWQEDEGGAESASNTMQWKYYCGEDLHLKQKFDNSRSQKDPDKVFFVRCTNRDPVHQSTSHCCHSVSIDRTAIMQFSHDLSHASFIDWHQKHRWNIRGLPISTD